MSSSNRQRILEGMLEAIGADGYEDTSVQDVLDRTGLYRQAFYDHFEDKEDCFAQAYAAALTRVETALRETTEPATTWTEALRLGLRTLLARIDAAPDTARAMLVEVHAAGPRLLALREETMNRAKAFLARALEEADESPPPIAGEGVAAGINSVIHLRLANGERDGFVALLPELVYFAVLPYYGPRRAGAEMRACEAA